MLYLVHATFGRTSETKAVQDIQEILDQAHSWYRFAPTSWIICTHESSDIWSDRLAHLVKGGTLFVTGLHPSDRQGWMTADFWAWMNEHAAHFRIL